MRKSVGFIGNKVKEHFVNYTLGLILCVQIRTCVRMGETLGLAHDMIYRYLAKAALLLPFFPNIMVRVVKHYEKQKDGYFIVDDTVLSKVFSRGIQGVDFVYNTITCRTERGFCLVVLVWTNGDITIPISFKLWFNKSICPNGKSKSELAIELVGEFYKQIKFKALLADGLYSTKTFLEFLCKKNIKFLMKMHRNRIVTNTEGAKGQLQHNPELKLTRNQRTKTLKGTWAELNLFFNVIKFRGRNGDYAQMYHVSNMDLPEKEYKKIYKERWGIEVMFRSMKQGLGITNCSSRDLQKQRLHFHAVFHSYAFLQVAKVKQEEPNVESVVRALRAAKPKIVERRISSFNRNFAYVA